MKQHLIAIMFATIFAACQSPKTNEQQKEMETATDNTLTDEQKKAGWILLFDGKSMDGWRLFKNKENDCWEAVDGTLHCKPFGNSGDNKDADIITTEQYQDFELVFDFKISPQGNSGVMFRVTEEYDQPYATGPEYQVLDDKNYPGEIRPEQTTASNYDMHVATDKQFNPPGEWNTGKILVKGNHVEHWLNGKKVVDYEVNSEDWVKRRDASKWKDFPGYATAARGHICLQDHGNEVWYKNIMIRNL